MDLNSILFPAPKSSYSVGNTQGELIWIPKNPHFIDEKEDNSNACQLIPDSKPRSEACNEFSYDAQLLKYRKLITVANENFKPKGVEPEVDEISFIATETNRSHLSVNHEQTNTPKTSNQ